MAIIDDLKTRRTAVVAKLNTLTADNLDLPDATGAHTVQYEAHKKGLYDELEYLDKAIARHDTGEVVSYGVI